MKRHLLLLIPGLLFAGGVLHGQGTGFTYQAVLRDGGVAADGPYDFEFSLFDSDAGGQPLGSPLAQDSVGVTNGLFMVPLDFGTSTFSGGARWIGISVRPHRDGARFTLVEPRQPLTPAPLAVAAQRATTATSATSAASAFAVTAGGVTTDAIAAGAITAGKIAADQVVRSVNGLRDDVALAGGDNILLTTNGNTLRVASPSWSLVGNAGTTPGVNFLGTRDSQPLELRVNNLPAFRLEPNTNGASVNVVAGHAGNGVDPDGWCVTIGGGGADFGPGLQYVNRAAAPYATIAGGAAHFIGGPQSTVGGGFSNVVAAGAVDGVIAGGSYNVIQDFTLRGTISGGFENLIGPNGHNSSIGGGWSNAIGSEASTIAGGIQHVIQPAANFATVGGGAGNVIDVGAFTATISGGGLNWVREGSYRSSIGGGKSNTIGPNSPLATISGGYNNTIQTNAEGATIPGGTSNVVAGLSGFAAGHRAQALHPGSFVWADSTDADFSSQTNNEFGVRATGGVRFITAVDSAGAPTNGVTLEPGSGSWSTLSDRRVKTRFEAVDPEAVLEKVAQLPLQTWSYVSQEEGIRHLGPMAQDFRAAFGLGENERTIATVDADGVALAAVQGLYRRLSAQEDELRAKERHIAKLEADLASLRALIERSLRPSSPDDAR